MRLARLRSCALALFQSEAAAASIGNLICFIINIYATKNTRICSNPNNCKSLMKSIRVSELVNSDGRKFENFFSVPHPCLAAGRQVSQALKAGREE